jgi:hypothetical protein
MMRSHSRLLLGVALMHLIVGSGATQEVLPYSILMHAARAYARESKGLLWRTQISVPIARLTQIQAFPILTAVGGGLFGRDTPVPQFVTLDVAKTFHAAVRGTAL